MVTPVIDPLSNNAGQLRRGASLARIERLAQQSGSSRDQYKLAKDQPKDGHTEYVIGGEYPLFLSPIWIADWSWRYDWFVDSARGNAILADSPIRSANRTACSLLLRSADLLRPEDVFSADNGNRKNVIPWRRNEMAMSIHGPPRKEGRPSF